MNRRHFIKRQEAGKAILATSGKPGLGYEYDEKFLVSRKRLA